MKQPFLVMIRSISRAPGLQKHLQAVIKKRWFRVAGITVAVFLVLLVALPFLINVNSFRPKIESEATNALGRQVTLEIWASQSFRVPLVLRTSALPTILPSASHRLSPQNR